VSVTARSRSLLVPRPVARPRLRLVCLPHAGASATMFVPWAGELPTDVELVAAQLPGRGARRHEPAATRLGDLLDELREGLSPWLDAPVALFGHSMGALLAFELARRLRGVAKIAWIVVSGHRAPHIPLRTAPLHRLDDAQLAEAIRGLGGTPDVLLRDADLLRLLLPTLRADFEAAETWTHRTDEVLDCPLLACAGLDDPHVTDEDLEGWRVHTRADFQCRRVRGDHFDVLAPGGPIVTELARRAALGVGDPS